MWPKSMLLVGYGVLSSGLRFILLNNSVIPQPPDPCVCLTMSISKTLLHDSLIFGDGFSHAIIAPEPRGIHPKNINSRDLVRYTNIFKIRNYKGMVGY